MVQHFSSKCSGPAAKLERKTRALQGDIEIACRW